jgi:putative ABC transport system permease protein
MKISRLAFRNVRRSFRDYFIYFLTLTVGVCVFYVFNSIESQQSIMEITQSQLDALRNINRMMSVVSVFISVIFGFLVLYANRFLIKRRKMELGIYMTLGMEKSQISRILMIETVFVGAFSLVVGLALGALLSQGLALVTARLFAAKLSSFHFIFSPEATIKAIVYFGITFAVVIIFNVFTISRQKLINLIYADRKNERFKQPHLVLSVCLFVAAIVCLAIAYKLIIANGLLRLDFSFWAAIALGCVGTFLFFFSLSGFFLKLISTWKRVYLKNLNMFVLRQINSKINTSYVSMTVVCLILFVSICTFSAGIGIATATTSELDKITPYDASLSIGLSAYITNDAGEYVDMRYITVDLLEVLRERNIDINAFAREYVQVHYYRPGVLFHLIWQGEGSTWQPDFIKLSDYNALLALQGKAPISLAPGDFAVNCTGDVFGLQTILAEYLRDNPTIELGGETFTYSVMYQHVLEVMYNSESSDIVVIVPDGALDGLDAVKSALQINYQEPKSESETLCSDALKWIDLSLDHEYAMSRSFNTKINVVDNSRNLSAVIAYLTIYIGVVFLIISAAVLAITQLAEAGDNAGRYGLLTKIGAESRMINGAILAQILIYFGAPMALALAHSFVGISVVSSVITAFGRLDILRDSVFTAGIVLLVYGGYLVATYIGSKGLVKKR